MCEEKKNKKQGKKVVYSLQLNLKEPLASGFVADDLQEAKALAKDFGAQSYDIYRITTYPSGKRNISLLVSKGELPVGKDLQMYYVNLYDYTENRIVHREYFQTYSDANAYAESKEAAYGIELYKYEANIETNKNDHDVHTHCIASFGVGVRTYEDEDSELNCDFDYTDDTQEFVDGGFKKMWLTA